MKDINIEKSVFEADLKTCLTIIERLGENRYKCQYISPALYVKIVIVNVNED